MTMAQAIASGLRLEAEARELGRRHARAGLRWCSPDQVDLLAYSLGYADEAAEQICRAAGIGPSDREDAA